MKILMTQLVLIQIFSSVYMKLVTDNLSTRIVTTNSGRLRGIFVEFEKVTGLQSVEAYLGLEYASLKGGKLRFMPPANPLERWEGVKIVNTFRPVCPQNPLNFSSLVEEMPLARVERLKKISSFTRQQAEECLYLNIYIPARERSSPAPVVVFIHGESYDFGTGNAYDGSAFSAYADVAVVTLNYRLGPLGFLSTGDLSATGNYALLDIVAALHWVQGNIADFGGDSSRVTLMGHGYGAALVNLLSTAPVTKRLNMFHRIILLSGSALAPWTLSQNPVLSAVELGSALNCLPSTPMVEVEKFNKQNFVQCLRNVSVDKINAAYQLVLKKQFVTGFGPVIDGILLESPADELLQRSDILFSHVPLLFGVTKYEGSNLLSEKNLDLGLTYDVKQTILRKFINGIYQKRNVEIIKTLDQHYKLTENQNSPAELKHKVIELLGDSYYNIPILAVGNHHYNHGKDTYFCIFSHSTREKDFPHYQGGHHGEDLVFVFGAPLEDSINPFHTGAYTKSDKVISEAVMRFFGNFINSGNPNIPLNDKPPSEITVDSMRYMDVYWPRYVGDTQQYLQLGTRPLVNHHYRRNRFALWTEVIPKLQQKPDDQSSEMDDDRLYVKDVPVAVNITKAQVDVRHVIPPPPTPPAMPPFREKTLIFAQTTTPSTVATEPTTKTTQLTDKHITSPPTAEAYNHAHQDITTLIMTNSGPVQNIKEQETNMDLTLSITIGVGSALLVLSIVIFVGIYCQRKRLLTEKKALEQLQQSEISKAESKGSLRSKQERVINITDNQLEKFEKMTESGTMNSNRTTESGRTRRVAEFYGDETVRDVQMQRGGSYKSHKASDFEVIKGIPDGPAKTAVDENMDRNMDVMGVNSSKRRSMKTSTSSQDSVEQKLSSREIPTPRQRNPERIASPSLVDEQQQPLNYYNPTARNNIGNGNTHSQQGRQDRRPQASMKHYHDELHNGRSWIQSRRPEEMHSSPRAQEKSYYDTPRQLVSKDSMSNDSGIHHMSYGH